MPTDDVSIRVRLRDAARFNREAKGVSRSIDDIGDQAQQAARKMRQMSASSSKARVSLGPFSTSLRGGALAVGGMALAVEKLTPSLLGATEAVATMTGGAGAAGGVGLLALGQAAGTVALTGLTDLTDALSGNAEAAKRLSPEMRDLFMTLSDSQKMLADTAQQGFLPGLQSGAGQAMRNLPVLNQIIGATAKELGGLAASAGGMAGSAEWGRDFATLGQTNVRVIDDLGHSGLFLADALKDVLVEAGPLTEWLSGNVRDGAAWVDQWINAARASGDMAQFFRDARTDLALLGSAGGHGTRGIINLFGSQDVDGTRTLRNLDEALAKFEQWTRTAKKGDLGEAIDEQIEHAVATLATAVAHQIGPAGREAASLFLHGFMEADTWGKLLVGGWLAKKLGLTKGLFGGGGPLGKGGGGLLGNKPIPVWVVNDMPNGPRGPGGPMGPLKKAGRFGKNLLKSPVGKGGVLAALAYGGYELGDAVLDDLHRERRRTGDWTPEQRRAEGAQTLQSFRPLNQQVVVDNDITLKMDGETLAQVTGTRVARRRARKAGTGFGGAAGP